MEKGNGVPIRVLELMKKEREKINFRSNFGFLMSHGGFKKGCFHLLVAPMSSGKSTLNKSLIEELTDNGKRVLVWLSEEDKINYSIDFNFNPELIYFIEESKKEYLNYKDGITSLKMACDEFEPDIIIFDNITTSILYQDHISMVDKIDCIHQLRRLITNKKIPMFMIAHTKKEITQNLHRMITIEDVRGFAAFAMTVEYAYCMNVFHNNGEIYNILNIAKKRFSNVKESYFFLGFDKGKYVTDYFISFEKIKQIFKKRDKL